MRRGKIAFRGIKQFGVIPETAQAQIAGSTQEAANLSRGMAMVNSERFTNGRESADGAYAVLQFVQAKELVIRDAKPRLVPILQGPDFRGGICSISFVTAFYGSAPPVTGIVSRANGFSLRMVLRAFFEPSLVANPTVDLLAFFTIRTKPVFCGVVPAERSQRTDYSTLRTSFFMYTLFSHGMFSSDENVCDRLGGRSHSHSSRFYFNRFTGSGHAPGWLHNAGAFNCLNYNILVRTSKFYFNQLWNHEREDKWTRNKRKPNCLIYSIRQNAEGAGSTCSHVLLACRSSHGYARSASRNDSA